MILAGDIGGTNARLGSFEISGERLRVITAETYPSRQHAILEEILELFMARQRGPQRAPVLRLRALSATDVS
jgi:glucokinase